MISVWGIDHGEDVSKKYKRLVGGALAGGAIGAGTYGIMNRSDKNFSREASRHPGKLSAISAGAAGATGLVVGGPKLAAGMAAGSGGMMYHKATRKKR